MGQPRKYVDWHGQAKMLYGLALVVFCGLNLKMGSIIK